MNMNPTRHAILNPMLKLSTQQQARLDELIDAYELARDAGKEISEADLCADDPDLLEPLLHAISQLKAVDKMLATVPTLPIPHRIGEFIVVEPLGTGATGMVFRCRQRNPNREVAVKVLKPLLEATEQHRRFQREIAALSVIQQDGIAAIFQSGVTDWCGTPCFWIAMELLDGGDVCQFLKSQPTSEANVLKAFRSICETLRAAHRLGILHRDVKPSNILMSDEGIPHLVDFGVAKLPASFEGVHQTEQGVRAVRGTAAWTAPELLLSERPVADVRSEIFSLGVVLFEMLTGRHPFAADQLTTPQIAARITQRTAVPISTALPNASVDLVAFLSRLMAFDPNERYQNLDDVLADTDRLLRGESVSVRVVPRKERAEKLLRKHWALATTATLVLAAVFSVFAIILVSSNQLREKDLILSDANELLSQQKTYLEDQAILLERSLQLRERTISNNRLRAMQSTVASMPMETLQTLEDINQYPEHLRGFAWQLLHREATIDVQELPNAGGSVDQLLFDPAMSRVFAACKPQHLRVYDLLKGDLIRCQASVLSNADLKLRPGSDTFLAVSTDRVLSEFSLASGELLRSHSETKGISIRFAVSADGQLVAGRIADSDLVVLNLETREVRRKHGLLNNNLAGIWFSPNGETVSLVDQSGMRLTCLSTDLSEVDRREPSETPPYNARPRIAEFSAFMDRGNFLAIGNFTEHIAVARVHANSETITNAFTLHGEVVRQVHLVPPRRLLSVGAHIRMHELLDEQKTRVLPLAKRTARSVAIADDGRTIAAGSEDGSVAIFKLDASLVTGETIPIFQNSPDHGFGEPKTITKLPDNDLTVVGFAGGWVAVVNTRLHQTIEAFRLASGPINSIHHDPQSGLVAIGSGGENQLVTVLRRANSGGFCSTASAVIRNTPNAVFTMKPNGDVRVLSFTDDGSRLLVALRNGDLLSIDCHSWAVQEQPGLNAGGIFAMAVHGDLCVTGGTAGDIAIRQISSDHEIVRWHAHGQRITDLVLSPDGSRIYSSSHDGVISIWDTSGTQLHSLTGHSGPIMQLELSRDGNTLASGGQDGQIMTWDAVTGDIQREMDAHEDHVTDLVFTDDCTTLLSSGLDGRVKRWTSIADQTTDPVAN